MTGLLLPGPPLALPAGSGSQMAEALCGMGRTPSARTVDVGFFHQAERLKDRTPNVPIPIPSRRGLTRQ